MFDPDEYECSACGRRFRQPASSCPVCGTTMKGTKDPQDWVEEMEMLDIMLGDDD
jgi:rRNA maturation endonuclease Nob1